MLLIDPTLGTKENATFEHNRNIVFQKFLRSKLLWLLPMLVSAKKDRLQWGAIQNDIRS